MQQNAAIKLNKLTKAKVARAAAGKYREAYPRIVVGGITVVAGAIAGAGAGKTGGPGGGRPPPTGL